MLIDAKDKFAKRAAGMVLNTPDLNQEEIHKRLNMWTDSFANQVIEQAKVLASKAKNFTAK